MRLVLFRGGGGAAILVVSTGSEGAARTGVRDVICLVGGGCESNVAGFHRGWQRVGGLFSRVKH